MAPGLVLSDSPSPVRESDRSSSSMDKPTVYLMDKFHPAAEAHAQKLFNAILPTDPEFQNWQQNAEYLLIKSSYLNASQIESATKLRAIGKQGVGLDRIDVEACKARDIRVFNTPGVNANAVAELVLTLTMAVARGIGPLQVRQSRGEAVAKETCSGLIMTGKKLGLIGMGNIGKTVARIFRGAFDARVVAYDPYMPDHAWDDVEHTRAQTVPEVLREADVVSVHVPLTPETRDLITYKDMATMKSNAIIINTARGGIINEADLVQALTDGLIWGAGLDCHEQEPPTAEKYAKLWKHPRVVSTPHIGAATAQTQMETAMAAVDKLHNFIVAS